VLSYEGPFGVGYGVAILFEPEKSGTEGTAAIDLEGKVVSRFADLPAVARCAVEAKLQNGPKKPPVAAGGELAGRHAVFVTVRTETGELRGCRGVTAPVHQDPVWETWHSAVAAACFDSRFAPATAAEMPRLRFTVTVLGQLEPVASSGKLNPAVYGIQVSTGDGRRGVLLPAIAGIDSVEQQIAVARQKAGIAENETVKIERFTTRSFSEPPTVPEEF
jgi:AMMECR1 domain-containing protein